MLDSIDILSMLKLVYSIYAVVIILLFAWFAYKLKGGETKKLLSPSAFYAYIGLLIFSGVFIHILTFNKIPWVSIDLKKDSIKIGQTFDIKVKDHKFILPSKKLIVRCGKTVKFAVDSKDLTYGFGLFRKNHTMVFQMQVVPGSKNDLVWRFHKNGTYSIRSTEYSGPKGAHMEVKDAVQVVGCKQNDKHSN